MLTEQNIGPTALITGASRGLGRALARALAARGWNLLLDGRDFVALRAIRDELATVTHVVALAGDVADPVHRHDLGVLARGMCGLDAVINNAGALGPSPLPPVVEYPLDAFESVLKTNVVAPLGVIQSVVADLKPGARIVNVSSDAGVEPYPGWGGYGASKAALEHLSAVLAVERPDLKVYWVNPGDMRTDMHQEAYPGEDISDRPLPEASVPGFVRLLEESFPSGRYTAQSLETSATVEVSHAGSNR